MESMTMSAPTSIWCFSFRKAFSIHDSSFISDIAVHSLINSPDHVSAENFGVYSLYACFLLGDKIFFWSPSTRRVHLFNANRIKS